MARQKKQSTHKLKIKKGDRVFVVAGSYKDLDRSKEVLEVFPKENRVIVDGVNIVKRHTKPTQDDPGGIKEKPASIHVSNVMLADPKTGEPTRVGRKRLESGKLVRISKKSGETID